MTGLPGETRKMRTTWLLALGVVGVVASVAVGAEQSGKKIRLVTREISLGTPDPQVEWASAYPSPNLKRMAHTGKRGGKWVVAVDGVVGQEYDGIAGSIRFSPDGKHLAYVARDGAKWVVVLDGVEGKQYDAIAGQGDWFRDVWFSADSSRVAYPARRGEKWLMVVDGVEGSEYDEVLPPRFSREGHRLGYIGKRDGKTVVVVDGVEGKEYDYVWEYSFFFSPNGRRFGYAARLGSQWVIVVDGKESQPYDGTHESCPIFSPDSKRVAYAAQRNGKWTVVVDGLEGHTYDRIWPFGTVFFSPDSKRVAYAAERAGKMVVVLDGVEQGTYDGLKLDSPLLFSPDSRRLAYVTSGKPQERKQSVVVDGVVGRWYAEVGRQLHDSSHWQGGPMFSPDSRRLAYVAVSVGRGRALLAPLQSALAETMERLGRPCVPSILPAPKFFVAVDGIEGRPYVRAQDLTFSPDGQRIAYKAMRSQKWLVVVDGSEGKPYDYVTEGPFFSPDSKRVVYVAKRGQKHLVVVDSAETCEYDGTYVAAFLPRKPSIFFTSPNSLCFLGWRDNQWLRVEVEIVEE